MCIIFHSTILRALESHWKKYIALFVDLAFVYAIMCIDINTKCYFYTESWNSTQHNNLTTVFSYVIKHENKTVNEDKTKLYVKYNEIIFVSDFSWVEYFVSMGLRKKLCLFFFSLKKCVIWLLIHCKNCCEMQSSTLFKVRSLYNVVIL